jgi:predicted nucleic acid-binding protein
MKRVLIDTNIVLDVLLERKPHLVASAAIWDVVESGSAEGFLAAHAITTVHYLAQKQSGARRAKRLIASLLQVFRVAPVDENVLRDALQSETQDFEDAVSAAAAHATGCEAIVTRDPKGFRTAGLPVLTPETAAPLFASR